jgi:hypothetical protein
MATPFNLEPTRDDEQLLALDDQTVDGVGEGSEDERPVNEVQALRDQMTQVLTQQQQENMRLNQQMQAQKLQTLQFYINALPTKAEKDYANSLVQQYYKEEGEKTKMNDLMRYTQTLEGYALDKLKKDVTRGISEKYKVEKELLEGLNAKHPQEVENVAKALAKYKKQMNYQQRMMGGNDRVPGTSQQSSQSTANSALVKKFSGTGRLADFIRQGGLG